MNNNNELHIFKLKSDATNSLYFDGKKKKKSFLFDY